MIENKNSPRRIKEREVKGDGKLIEDLGSCRIDLGLYCEMQKPLKTLGRK